MSKYLITINDNYPFEEEGASPREAIASRFPNIELVEVKNKEQAQVSIELVGGKKKSIHYYYIESVKGAHFNIVTARNNVDDNGVEVAGIFLREDCTNKAREIVANWQQENGFGEGEVYVGQLEFNRLLWYDIDTRIKRTVKVNKKFKELYILTAKNDRDASGVEVAGLFASDVDANKARRMIEKWQKDNGFDTGVTFVAKMEPDIVYWYDKKYKLYLGMDKKDFKPYVGAKELK